MRNPNYFLTFLLVMTGFNIELSHCETTNPLSVKFLDDPCSFSICLSNTGKSPMCYVDSFGKDYRSKTGVPGYTWVYVRDQDGHMVSGLPGASNEGYTWLTFRSQIDPMPTLILKPGESLSVNYSLKKLSFGLFEKTKVKRESIGSYQIKLKTKVFLNEDMKVFVEAETDWVKFPACLESQ